MEDRRNPFTANDLRDPPHTPSPLEGFETDGEVSEGGANISRAHFHCQDERFRW